MSDNMSDFNPKPPKHHDDDFLPMGEWLVEGDRFDGSFEIEFPSQDRIRLDLYADDPGNPARTIAAIRTVSLFLYARELFELATDAASGKDVTARAARLRLTILEAQAVLDEAPNDINDEADVSGWLYATRHRDAKEET